MELWVTRAVVLIAVAVFSDAAALSRPPEATAVKPEVPQDLWFRQYLDHYNVTDKREWKQRYHEVTKYYQDGGPVFLDLGGEWELSATDFLLSTAHAFAKKFKGMVFELEHRFYGLSHPTPDVSTKNLQYLSADQALADTAYFIQGMNEKHKLPGDTKWVVLGGSYSANLAAWMREKYSHLVYAAVADSGPLLAKVNFFDYVNVVKEALDRCTPKCVTAIQEAHNKFKKLLETEEGRSTINKKFKLCDPIDPTIKNDKYSLIGSLADNLAGVIQYNSSYSLLTVEQVCKTMLNTSISDIIDRYAEVNNLIQASDDEECLNYKYDKVVEEMKNVSWEAKSVTKAQRQWTYQTCTEYGYYQTSINQSQLFFEDIPLYLNIQLCKDVYGEIYNEDLVYKGQNRTNILYGGLNNQATRVAYIYSEGDPWCKLGNSKTIIQDSPVVYIEGASHCSCVYELPDTEPPAVHKAWHEVEGYVEKWVKE